MSDNYRALTRKYRPHTFDDIVSQEHVSSTLMNAIENNRLSHAYMFCGPRGVGKTTMARVLARKVNQIDQDIDGESLNQTLNVVEIDAASNNSVEDIRDLRERVRIPPQNGRYKIYIIDEVHMLSKSAFNALLKTLEEPPDHIIFIFATTEPHKVLPTILSRVQRFDFKRLKINEIVPRLREISDREDISIDDESLHVIAKKADGALRDALGLMDQAIAFCGTDIQHEELLRALNMVSTDRLFELMEAVRKHDSDRGLSLINDVLREGYDILEFLTELLEHLRNLYVAKNSENMHLVETSDETRKRYLDAASSFSKDDLMRMLHIVSEAQYRIKEAQQPRIQFEVAILKLIHMQRSETLQHLISGLEELKKKFENGELNKQKEKTGESGGQTTDSSGTSSSSSSSSRSNAGSSSDTSPPEKQEPDSRSDTPEYSPSDVQHSAATDEKNAESSDTSSEKEDYNFFGQPSFDTYNNDSSILDQKQHKAENEPGKRPASTNSDKSSRKLDFNELKQQWADFIKQLEGKVPQMLFIQLQRIEPVKLKGQKLILRCGDHFAKQLINEHRSDLKKKFNRFADTYIELSCNVQNKTGDNNEKSPYERFKKLQERDPRIRTIVELFGAELEY